MQKLSFIIKKDDSYNLLKISLKFIKEINDEEEFYPEQKCSLILKKIKMDTEFYLSEKIWKKIEIYNCVITVPAYFNQKQR